MQKRELESWLCGQDASFLSPARIASLLGVAPAVIDDTTLLRTAARRRAVQFTLAVLCDAFADDVDVRGWLQSSRADLGGRAPIDLLFAGQSHRVEELAMRAWQSPGDAGLALEASAGDGLARHRAMAEDVAVRRYAPAV